MVERKTTTLVSRNLVIGRRRTSVRLEPPMWESLEEIARREGAGIHALCTGIAARRRESALTAAIRVFVLGYFRAAATEDGHRQAGHGAERAGAGARTGARTGASAPTYPLPASAHDPV